MQDALIDALMRFMRFGFLAQELVGQVGEGVRTPPALG